MTISGQLSDHYLEGSAEVEVTVSVELVLDDGLVGVVDAYMEERRCLPTIPTTCSSSTSPDGPDRWGT